MDGNGPRDRDKTAGHGRSLRHLIPPGTDCITTDGTKLVTQESEARTRQLASSVLASIGRSKEDYRMCVRDHRRKHVEQSELFKGCLNFHVRAARLFWNKCSLN